VLHHTPCDAAYDDAAVIQRPVSVKFQFAGEMF